MASNQGNQANRRDQGEGRERGSSSDSRGFAGMNEEEQRRIAQMGGEASARQQKRDADGQFASDRGGSSDDDRGRSSGGSDGGSRGGGQSSGGSQRGGGSQGSEKSSGRQGGSKR